MKLSDLISQENRVPQHALLFLRHGNDSVQKLRQYGVTIEEFTAIQPIKSKYDYLHPEKDKVEIVVVIVDDHIYRPFRILGVEAEGTDFSVGSDAYKLFNAERRTVPRPCRRFLLEPLTSIATGLPVRGWEGRSRTPVQRRESAFFAEIEVGIVDNSVGISEQVQASFETQVQDALREAPEARLNRLQRSPNMPSRTLITAYSFARNPDVVAEVLFRARGVCQVCNKPAPFVRRSGGSPYLEVHHRKPLAKGGEDTIENAIAVCPNCHRAAHYA